MSEPTYEFVKGKGWVVMRPTKAIMVAFATTEDGADVHIEMFKHNERPEGPGVLWGSGDYGVSGDIQTWVKWLRNMQSAYLLGLDPQYRGISEDIAWVRISLV